MTRGRAMSEEIERVNYYQLEYLGAEDFKAEQAYHRDMRRRHNVAHHLIGIVTGLEILEVPKPSGTGYDVYVQPGFAIDGFGREIVVTAPHKLDATDFRSFKDPGTHKVFIAYREQLDTPPDSGYASCDEDDQNKRVREDFRIVIDPAPPPHPPIVVGGKNAVVKSDPASPTAPVVIPDDESVPYQDFPDDRQRWLVRLGSATWIPSTGIFDATPLTTLVDGRVYTGIVAENVVSPAAELMLRPRDFTAGKEDDADFAEVQGRLQVDGRIVAKKDIFIHGGKLSLQRKEGDDDSVPFTLQRKPPAGLIGYDLRADIGPAGSLKQRLSVGTDSDDPAKAKTILAVRADDNVDIDTGKLNFGTKTLRQIVNFQAEDFGVGVQKSGTLYHRAPSAYAWYRGGKHDDTPAPTGPGGTMAMELNAANKLKVYGPIEADSLHAQYVQTDHVYVDGGQVHLRMPGGFTDTDDITIGRFNHQFNRNDLRVVIGDDVDGFDAFTIGPQQGTNYLTQFRVANSGDVTMKGHLSLDAGKFLNIDTMRLGGNFPVDVIVARPNVSVTNGSGVFPPLASPPLQVVSRMQHVSSVQFTVALTDISNAGQAVNASWYVYPHSASAAGNVVSYRIGYSVTDSDGSIGIVTVILVMVP